MNGSSGAAIANWFASYSDSTTQIVTASNTPTVITYDTTEIANGIILDFGQQIRYPYAGIYEIGYSLQI